MVSRRWALGLLLAGCGTEPARQPNFTESARTAVPASDVALPEEVQIASPEPTQKIGTMPAIGPWLDPSFDLDAATRKRARIIRPPAVRAEHDGSAIVQPSAMLVDDVVPVLESSAADVRVACEGDGARVALFVDREVLADVALTGALLVGPAPTAEAGLHVMAGTQLREVEARGEVSRVRVETPGWSASGTISSAHIGQVFDEQAPPTPVQANVQLERGALLDAPHGTPFLQLEPPFEQLARQRDKRGAFSLIELVTPLGPALGWIETKQLRPIPSDTGSIAGVAGVGERYHSHASRIVLPRGRLLRVDDRRVAIGVMLQDATMWCFDGCGGRRPVVEVCACGVCIGLEAMGPAAPVPAR